MEIETHWSQQPSFQDRYPQVWDNIRRVIDNIRFEGSCHISLIDYNDKIQFGIKDIREEIIGELHLSIAFLQSDPFESAEDRLLSEIDIIVGVGNYNHLLLLKHVYQHYLNNGRWPLSRNVMVKANKLGDFWTMTNSIGRGYLRVSHPKTAKSTIRLTVKRVWVCDQNSEYGLNFIKLFMIFLRTFQTVPTKPDINTKDLIGAGVGELGSDMQIIEIVSEEDGLVSALERPRGKFPGTFTVSENILKYEKISGIRDYLRLQKYEVSDLDYSTAYPPPTGKVSDGPLPGLSSHKYTYDVFISYSSRDDEAARVIYSKMETAGLRPFLAPKDIDSGETGSQKIKEALRNSTEVVFLMSPRSIESEWVLTEWGATWILEKHVTPLLLDCSIRDIPKLLQDRQKREYPEELDRYVDEVVRRRST